LRTQFPPFLKELGRLGHVLVSKMSTRKRDDFCRSERLWSAMKNSITIIRMTSAVPASAFYSDK
jgi:hypothetical protein